MPGTHPHIEVLRRYLRNVSTLPAAEMDNIERHLQSCAFCYDIVRESQEFMKIRETVDPRRVATETDKLLEKIRTGKEPAAQPIVMYARQQEKRTDAGQSRRPVLAAAGETTAAQEFSALATLFSADERVMLRILLDHLNDEYAIYILTEKQEDAAFLLVESPLSDVPLMTDSSGMCRTPVRRELLVETDSFRLLPPRESTALSRAQSDILQSEENDGGVEVSTASYALSMRHEHNYLVIQTDGLDEETPPAGFVGAVIQNLRLTATCENGIARLPLTPPYDNLRLLIY